MKKKLTALCLCVALLAVAVVGASSLTSPTPSLPQYVYRRKCQD